MAPEKTTRSSPTKADEEEAAAPDPTLSSDATHSTKKAAEVPETNPPSGPAVEEERGKPSGG